MSRCTKLRRTVFLLTITIASAGPLWARPQPVPGLPFGGLAPGGTLPWNIVVLLTLLTLLPAILLSMTPFVRLLVVFHFLRQALGTQTAPSNQVLMGLALMMTWFLMQPVMQEVEQSAVTPYLAGAISGAEAMDRGADAHAARSMPPSPCAVDRAAVRAPAGPLH